MGPRKTDQDILALIAAGESESVEFKLRDPPAAVVARNVAAFANSRGGILLLGVSDRGELLGVGDGAMSRVQEAIGRRVQPPPECDVYSVDVRGIRVGVVDVAPSTGGPVLSDGAVFVRVGTRIAPASASQILATISSDRASPLQPAAETARLAEVVAQQTTAINGVQARLDALSSWKAKVPDYLVGGLIGAVLGWLVTWLLGCAGS